MEDLDKRVEIYWSMRKIGFDHIKFNYPKVYENLYPLIKERHREFKVIEDVVFYYLFIQKGEI